MYAKSFIAHASRGRLTSAVTARATPYDHYACHLCGSALVFHPEWGSERPWFEHTENTLTENGRKHCPYVIVTPKEMHFIQKLRRLVSDAAPVVRKTDWYCMECNQYYYGERYCLRCRSGSNSTEGPAKLSLSWTPGAKRVTCVC
ncbi:MULTISPECIES: putative zinc ribbon protein [Yersinia]|uniref:putative zinc ribbon protein n=1 Tax=Yersinia TaxID=629 RepID=UPI0011A60EDE|nr:MULTISPECIES: putative zinc ribbon protein [Yersinia]ELY5259095.1 hypothetical protein [Yersinia enterocolitica]